MNNRDAQKLIDLDSAIRLREGQIEDLKAQRAEIEARLLANFQQAGIDRVTVAGRTIWLDRKLWAGADNGNTPLLAAALKEVGLEDLVKEAVNAQQLSSWVREHDPEKCLTPEEVIERLPEPVRPHIRVTEKFALRVRKAQ